MPSTHRRRELAAAFIAVLALLTSMLVVSAPSAVAAVCTPPVSGLVVNQWTGGAGDGLWVSPANWSLGRAPDNTDDSSGYVCIDANRTVTMRAGESAEIQAIDVSSGTTLVLARGSMLYVLGDQDTMASHLRQGSTVRLSGVLGGTGRYQGDGLVTWTSTALGASTMTSRRCGLYAMSDLANRCPAAVSGTPGLLVVGNTGVLSVNGRGVNLLDQFQITVHGTLKLQGTAGAYIAADRGTSLELAPKVNAAGVGSFLLANDGGWYEGRTMWITTPSTVVNGGLIKKTGGTGTSVIDGTYSRVGTGKVQVITGTLVLPETMTHGAVVGSGDAFGFGGCVTAAYGCLPVADAANPQTASLQIPATDATGATVLLALDGAGPAGTVGQEIHATATGLTTTAGDPAILSIRYDTSILGGQTWATLVVQRQPEGGGSYATVLACDGAGLPPSGQSSCVDRRGLSTSSRTLVDGDALMVVRTTVFSRWVAL